MWVWPDFTSPVTAFIERWKLPSRILLRNSWEFSMKESGIKFSLPEHLAEKASSFPETSYGATRLTLVLEDGTRVPHVHVAGRDVIKATGIDEQSFLSTLDPKKIVDVLRES
jgi:hypothetical protein